LYDLIKKMRASGVECVAKEKKFVEAP
jgi:hypothetical protein